MFLRRAGTKLASTLIKPDPPSPTDEEGGSKNPMNQFVSAITEAYVKVKHLFLFIITILVPSLILTLFLLLCFFPRYLPPKPPVTTSPSHPS